MERNRKPSTGKPPSGGFSLVELVLATLLLSLGVLGLAPLFIQATGENDLSADLGSLSAVAVSRMERLQSADYLALMPGGSLDADVAGYCDLSDPDQIVRWEITDNASPSRTKTIRLRVVTPARSGPRREVTVVGVNAK